MGEEIVTAQPTKASGPKKRRRTIKRRQGGSIVRRGSGFTIIYRTPDGKQKWQGGFPSKTAARNELNKVLDKINEGKFVDVRPVPFADFCERWLKIAKDNLKPSTWTSYHAALRKWLLPRFGEWDMCDITRPAVSDFADELKGNRELTRKTVKNIFVLLHKLFEDAVEKGYATANPADKLKIGKKEEFKPSSERAVPTPEWVVRTFEHLPGVYQVLLFTGAVTGLRRAELLGLSWDDVDLSQRVIRVRKTLQRVKKNLLREAAFRDVEQVGKTGLALVSPKSDNSSREVEIPQKLAAMLHELRESKNGAACRFVFQDEFGMPISPERLRHVFGKARDKAGVGYFDLHGLRHLYCSLLRRSGAPAEHAKDRLGHASVRTTLEIYSHNLADDDEGRYYAEQVEAAFPIVRGMIGQSAADPLQPTIVNRMEGVYWGERCE